MEPQKNLSAVDQHLLISDVCKVFGQFVRYNVVVQLAEGQCQAIETTPLPNAFTILMRNSAEQSAAEHRVLPDVIPEKTNKDKLFNALIAAMEKNGQVWKGGGGNTHGTPFVHALCDALWCIDGHHHTFAEAGYPISPNFKEFVDYNRPEQSKHRK